MTRFRSTPPDIRGSIAPLITPFTDDGDRRPREPARPGRVAARERLARHLDRRLDRRAGRPERSASGSRRSRTVATRSPTGCRSCRHRLAQARRDPRAHRPGCRARRRRRRSSSRRTTRAPPRRRSTSGTRRSPREFPDLPIVAYNVPSRTAVDIAPETVARLYRDLDNFVGVKETTKDFEHFSRVHAALRAATCSSGRASSCSACRCSRSAAPGFLSATANIAPGGARRDVRAVGGGRPRGRPRASTTALHPLVDLLFVETNPAPGKWVLEQRGLIRSRLRAPAAHHADRGRAGQDPRLLAEGARVPDARRRLPDRSPRMTGHHVPDGLPDKIRHYIDGEFVDSVGGETFDVLDPVSNETYVTAAAGQTADVDLAVAAATRAFPEGPWPRMKPRERVAHPEPDRRRRRGAGRPPGRARDLRHRPADHPGARPGAACRRELPLLRRPDRRPGRRHLQGARPRSSTTSTASRSASPG